ncbi:MAG TPA: hypothetical protein VF571_09105 [Pyrinomonadaceae bacterium]|jgi:hypothetical protein
MTALIGLLILIVVVLIVAAVIASSEENKPRRQPQALAPQPNYQYINNFQLDYQSFEDRILAENGISRLKVDPQTQQVYQQVFDFYNPNSGWFSSFLQEKKFKKQSEIVSHLSEIQSKLLNSVAQQAIELQLQRLEAAQYYVFLHRNFNDLLSLRQQIERTQQAWEQHQMTVEDVSEVNKHRQKTQIDLDNKIQLMEQEVRWALVAKTLSRHQKMLLVQELLDTLYKQIEQIDTNQYLQPATKTRMITDRNKLIGYFQNYIDEEGNQLLEAR